VVSWLDEPPVAGMSHLTWCEGGGCHNMESWESEGAFNNFGGDRLGQEMARIGLDVQPQVTFHPAHEVFTARSVMITN